MGTGAVTLGGNVQLTVTNANTLTVGGPVTLTSSVNTADTLSVTGAGNVSFSSAISNGSGSGASLGLTMSGSGTLTLSISNTYTGPTIVNSGILILAHNTATIATNSAGLTINGGGTVQITATNALANSGTAVPITINNGGVLETGSAAAVDSWIGPLTLSGGTLSGLGTANTQWGNWQMGGTLTVTPGTGYSSTISAPAITEQQTGGLIFNVGQSGATSGIDLLVSSAIVQGTSAGSTGLILNGPGTTVLSGANTYTSQTSINQGTLRVNAGGTLGATTAPVTIGTGTAGTFGTVANLAINTNTQIGALSVISNTSDTTTPTNIDQLTIPSGITFTTSALSVGVSSSATANTNTALGTGTPQSGAGGTLTVNGNVAIGNNTNNAGSSGVSNETAVVDLSGLSNFNETATTGSLLLGYGFRSTGILTLAANNNINVGTITVGNANGQNGGANIALNLGSGTSVLDANAFNIGIGKNCGNVQFAGPTGSVTIAGTGGGAATANITIADATGGKRRQCGGVQPFARRVSGDRQCRHRDRRRGYRRQQPAQLHRVGHVRHRHLHRRESRTGRGNQRHGRSN